MSPRRSVQTGRRNAYADSPSIQRSLANGGFLQEDVAKPSIQRPSGLGRVETAAVGLARSSAGVGWKSQSGHQESFVGQT